MASSKSRSLCFSRARVGDVEENLVLRDQCDERGTGAGETDALVAAVLAAPRSSRAACAATGRRQLALLGLGLGLALALAVLAVRAGPAGGQCVEGGSGHQAACALRLRAQALYKKLHGGKLGEERYAEKMREKTGHAAQKDERPEESQHAGEEGAEGKHADKKAERADESAEKKHSGEKRVQKKKEQSEDEHSEKRAAETKNPEKTSAEHERTAKKVAEKKHSEKNKKERVEKTSAEEAPEKKNPEKTAVEHESVAKKVAEKKHSEKNKKEQVEKTSAEEAPEKKNPEKTAAEHEHMAKQVAEKKHSEKNKKERVEKTSVEKDPSENKREEAPETKTQGGTANALLTFLESPDSTADKQAADEEADTKYQEVSGCREGTVGCGGLCLPGASDSVCCVSPEGAANLCSSGNECCEGLCMAEGTGCAKECGPGLISCGGQCVVGTKEDVCCASPTGRGGMMCAADDLCCDGVCSEKHSGCSKNCSVGMISCGGECLAGGPDDQCCEGPSGKGIVCPETSQCCDGSCLAHGEGCAALADGCREGLIACAGECVPATEGSSCCMATNDTGILCGPGDECCDGVCMAQGAGCSKSCGPGMVSCGGVCMVGNATDSCCLGPAGNGMICEATAQCCDGVCVPDGEGCAKTCAEGMVHCGGKCMYGTPEDKCCLNGKTGDGLVCAAHAECCDGSCVEDGMGCAARSEDGCGPDMMACGGECLPGSGLCCASPSGKGGVLCGSGDECCDGACAAAGTGCAKECGPGLISCGGECLPGKPGSKCCTSQSGTGMLCSAGDECCSGVCVSDGLGCAKECAEGFISCGGECLAASSFFTKCCEGPTGAGVLCGADQECCGGLCEAKGSPCGLSF